MAANVPASIVSRYYTGTHFSTLAIGKNFYPPKADLSTSFYWYTVVDLTNLNVPDVAVSTANDTVPANIAKYLGNDRSSSCSSRPTCREAPTFRMARSPRFCSRSVRATRSRAASR